MESFPPEKRTQSFISDEEYGFLRKINNNSSCQKPKRRRWMKKRQKNHAYARLVPHMWTAGKKHSVYPRGAKANA
jgi:hypothetical protein